MLRRAIGSVLLVLPLQLPAGEIAFTLDDAPTPNSAAMTGAERSTKLINALRDNGVKEAVFFVLAKNITEASAPRLK